MSAPLHQGGCLCGAVRFEAEGAPKFIANCHCNSCRKATGAAFSTWVGFSDANIRWLKNAPAFHQSSPGVERGFCRDCGTPLTYAGAQWPDETHFLIGVFDAPESYTPSGDVFADDALPWAQRIEEAKP